jgi:transcription initiation factor TFIID TATA-box-binding protein
LANTTRQLIYGVEMTGVRIKIQNIVCSVTYEDTEFNLNKLVRSLDGARYDPELFAGLAYRSDDPRASFLIFASGKMNCVGARSMNDAKLAIKKLTRKLRKARIKVKSAPKVKVQNIVASVDFGRKFDLEHIARRFENTEYNPEVFPGVVFRLDDPKAVLLLFVSGKGVCAGVKSMRDVKRAAQKTNRIISRR